MVAATGVQGGTCGGGGRAAGSTAAIGRCASWAGHEAAGASGYGRRSAGSPAAAAAAAGACVEAPGAVMRATEERDASHASVRGNKDASDAMLRKTAPLAHVPYHRSSPARIAESSPAPASTPDPLSTPGHALVDAARSHAAKEEAAASKRRRQTSVPVAAAARRRAASECRRQRRQSGFPAAEAEQRPGGGATSEQRRRRRQSTFPAAEEQRQRRRERAGVRWTLDLFIGVRCPAPGEGTPASVVTLSPWP